MTLDEIRKLAERALQPPSRDGGPNPTPDLARFAIAVLDALDALGGDRGPLGTSHVGPMLASGIRDAITRNLERSK